jgi:class 3 adenylate cyclase/tetratricopeptide (TPR) repeat protein
MVVCPDCGHENPAKLRTCASCGSQLSGRVSQRNGESRRTVTIVTSDWKGSTSLGERLDAESLREVQTRYFDEMRMVFEAHGGTIQKIIGDAIVVVFGVPIARDDDPLRAVAAAAESIRTLASLNDQFAQAYGIQLLVRTGIATGEVVFGEERSGQQVLSGEVTAIATALEQSAPADEVLLAPTTYKHTRGLIDVEASQAITTKAGRRPITPYRLIAISAEAERAIHDAEEADGRTTERCPTCGADNPQNSATCSGCGASLARTAAALERRKTVSIVFANPRPSVPDRASASPDALREATTRYFAVMRPILEKHGGTVEKFIGDAVMAVFGLPVLHEDDALRASRAALEMQAALPGLNAELASDWGVGIDQQIGVNTGEVIAGDASLGQRLVTGDAVNIAARLEQAAAPQEVLIGELTHRLVRDAVQVEPVQPLQLKGKAEHVPAYRLLSVSAAVEGYRRRQDAPMVGREAEMALLSEIFQRARIERGGRMATVIADAGTGKSRLIREFVEACDPTSLVLRGRCLPYGEGITFWPLVEAARAAAGIEPDDSTDQGVGKLRALIGDAAVVDRIAAAIGLTREQFSLSETFWATRKMIELVAKDRIAIWVIDDIHWAEETLLDLIVFLLEQAEAPLLVVCSSRHDLLDTHSDWAVRSDSVRLILKPLSDADAGQVVQNLLGKAGIAGEVQDRIVAAAEGNPLYVEQMLSMLIDSGRVRMVGDRWEPTVDLSQMSIPPTIQALLSARLDLLAQDERSVIEPASVIGLEFAEAAVEELAPEQIRLRVPDHLKGMTRKQLVRPSASTNADDTSFRFMHILIKDATYSGLLKRSRAQLHERFVNWADQINRERGRSQEYEEILGYHLEQAYRYLTELGQLDDHGREVGARASTLLASAGRRAQARGDTPAAANLLRRAAATRARSDPERLELLPNLGEALLELGEFAQAKSVLEEAVGDAAAAGNDRLAAKATLVDLMLQLYSEETTAWTSLVAGEVDRVMPIFEAADDHAGLALAWRLRFGMYGTTGQYGKAAEAAEEEIEHARLAGDFRLQTRGATGYAHPVKYGPIPVTRAVERLEALTNEIKDDRRSVAAVHASLAQLYAMQGEFERARKLYNGARALLQDLGGGVLSASTSLDSAQVEILAGDYLAAERELRRDYEALSAMGEKYLRSTIGGLLARALVFQGRHDEAEQLTRDVEAIASEDDTDAQAVWRGARARALANRAELTAAITLAEEAVALRRRTDSPVLQAEALSDLAEVLRLSDRFVDARAALQEALSLVEAKGDIVSTKRVRAEIEALAESNLQPTG